MVLDDQFYFRNGFRRSELYEKVVFLHFLDILVQKLYSPSFRYANWMLISYYANKKVPQGCRRGNQAKFFQYTYRFMINHKTLYSQTFQGPQFDSWTSMENRLNENKSKCLSIFKRVDRILIGNNKKIANNCKSPIATYTFIWFITYWQYSLIDVAYVVLAHFLSEL